MFYSMIFLEVIYYFKVNSYVIFYQVLFNERKFSFLFRQFNIVCSELLTVIKLLYLKSSGSKAKLCMSFKKDLPFDRACHFFN